MSQPSHTKLSVANAAVVFILLACGAGAARAQDAATAPAAPASAASAPAEPARANGASTEAAREALGKKEGDVDQAKVLKETLSAADKQYSLLRAGKHAITYDLTYTYIGQQQISAKFTDQKLTQFAIQNTRGHTITNTVSADYGVKDNLTANVTLPLVSKYSQSETFSGLSNAIGDVSVGARLQPFPVTREFPALTATATLRLPTGRSPYKTIDGQGLATGAGYTSATLGMNASKVIDPVAIFGSFNVSYGLPVKHLNQMRNGETLKEVHPGLSVGFGVGFAYALSYNVSTTMSFQESISARTRLKVIDANGNLVDSKTSSQSSAMLNMGLGLRVSPVTTLNFTVGIGLTTDTPDFSFGMNMPLNF
ncbi:MAG TPA: transporter [Albitalea sp.]|nr:transporter [Albitalea sp.]